MLIDRFARWLSHHTFWKLCLAAEILVLVCLGLRAQPLPEIIPHTDKWMHGFGFMVATLTGLLAASRRWQWWTVVGLMSFLGILIEILQALFLPGRSCDLLDWLGDMAGVGIAVTIWWLLSHFIMKRQSKE